MADDPTNPTSGAGTPATPPIEGEQPAGRKRTADTPSGDPPGIRAQVGATFEAVKRLLNAHVELAKAEFADIASSVARMVGLFAAAFAMALLVGMLLVVGGLLFLGEWLFGSIGWGVLLGTLLLLDIALTAVLVALDVSPRRVGTAFGIAAVIGLAVGLVMGFDLTHRGWTTLGDSVAAAYDPNTRAVLLAMGITAAVGALLGLLSGLRARSGAIGRLIAGAIAGVLLGLLTVISIPAQVGAALGVLVGLIAWPALAGRDVLRTGIDGEALKKKFTPEATIELTKETIEWVRARTPLVPKS